MKIKLLSLSVIVLLTAVQTAPGYVGTGAGLSLLGTLWGSLLAIGAVVGFIILWPLRWIRQRVRLRSADSDLRQTSRR
jgi:uncharacterized membrane protein